MKDRNLAEVSKTLAASEGWELNEEERVFMAEMHFLVFFFSSRFEKRPAFFGP